MSDEVKTVDPKVLADAKLELRTLAVKLTPAEVDARRVDVVRLTGEAAELAVKVESEKEAAKQRVKAVEGELVSSRALAATLARYASTGEEPRQVEVAVAIDRAARKRIVVRRDTGEIVESRAADPEEIEAGCDWLQDLEKGVAHLTHAPTGVVVRTRILEAAERQLTIDATAPRELVWLGAGQWAQATADEVEALECPVPCGTRLKWVAAGDAWVHASVPKGPTLDGLLHQLARLDLPFKVGNDAPKTIGDLARRKSEDKAAAGGNGKLRSVTGRKAPASDEKPFG